MDEFVKIDTVIGRFYDLVFVCLVGTIKKYALVLLPDENYNITEVIDASYVLSYIKTYREGYRVFLRIGKNFSRRSRKH